MAVSPRLVVDLERLQANIQRCAAFARERGFALRPHVKTHKTVEIARLQRDAGASGISVATLGEAEVFVAAGFDDVFVAYPLWTDDDGRRRLAVLSGRAGLRVGFDSLEAARRLVGTGVVGVVEVDSGHHRSGVSPASAGRLAADAAASGLPVVGVFTFPGHSYSPGGRERAASGEAESLAEAAASLAAAGVEPAVVSGGSTPSLSVTGEGLTEVRPGVYVFNDAQQWELGSCTPDQIALTCTARTVSLAGGRVVLDSGSKVLGADRPAWASGFGRMLDHPDARIVLLSEHHAVVDAAREALPRLGSRMRVVPNHACNAVNLVDSLDVRAGDEVVAVWPVAARGRNDGPRTPPRRRAGARG